MNGDPSLFVGEVAHAMRCAFCRHGDSRVIDSREVDDGQAAVRPQPQGPHREQDRDVAPRVHRRGGRRQAAMPATPSNCGRIVPNA